MLVLAAYRFAEVLLVLNGTSFPRTLRMTAPSEFKAALRNRPVVQGKIFSLHWCACSVLDDTARESKVGFIIPKRLLRRAVDRNRIKRVLRESFRLTQNDLPAGLYLFRLKAIPQSNTTLSLKHLARLEADSLLKKIQQRV